jgi:hypothetical protein
MNHRAPLLPDLYKSARHLAFGEALLEHTVLAMEIAAFASLIGNVGACVGTAATKALAPN